MVGCQCDIYLEMLKILRIWGLVFMIFDTAEIDKKRGVQVRKMHSNRAVTAQAPPPKGLEMHQTGCEF